MFNADEHLWDKFLLHHNNIKQVFPHQCLLLSFLLRDKKKKSSCRVTEEQQIEKPSVQKDLVVEN